MIDKLKKWDVNKKELLASMFLLMAFFSFIVAMGVWTIHINSGLSRHWYDFFLFLTLLGICASDYLFILSENVSVILQNSLLFGGLSLLLGLFCARKECFESYPQGGYWLSLVIVSVILFCIFITNLLFVKNKDNITFNEIFHVFLKKIKKSIWILIIIVLLIIIRFLFGIIQPRWDGALLYNYLLGVHSDEVLSFYSTSFCGHLSQAYCGINVLLGFAFDNLLLGMSVGNMFLFVVSVFSVFKLFKILFLNFSNSFILLFTVMYALSPLTFGMVNYNYWDQWAIYLMPIVVYTLLARKWILHFFFAIIMCFTKETSLIQYFGLCLGFLLMEIIFEKKKMKAILFGKKMVWNAKLGNGMAIFIFISS